LYSCTSWSDIFVYLDQAEQVTTVIFTQVVVIALERASGMVKDMSVDSKRRFQRSKSEEGSTVAQSKMEEVLRRKLDRVKGQVGIVYATVK
jgi:hypothetical protein